MSKNQGLKILKHREVSPLDYGGEMVLYYRVKIKHRFLHAKVG